MYARWVVPGGTTHELPSYLRSRCRRPTTRRRRSAHAAGRCMPYTAPAHPRPPAAHSNARPRSVVSSPPADPADNKRAAARPRTGQHNKHKCSHGEGPLLLRGMRDALCLRAVHSAPNLWIVLCSCSRRHTSLLRSLVSPLASASGSAQLKITMYVRQSLRSRALYYMRACADGRTPSVQYCAPLEAFPTHYVDTHPSAGSRHGGAIDRGTEEDRGGWPRRKVMTRFVFTEGDRRLRALISVLGHGGRERKCRQCLRKVAHVCWAGNSSLCEVQSVADDRVL